MVGWHHQLDGHEFEHSRLISAYQPVDHRLYPPLPMSIDGKGEENTAIRGCALPRNRGKEPHYRCPSEGTTASSSGRMGHYHPPPVACYYQPFSSTDMLNWQRHAPPYSGQVAEPPSSVYSTAHITPCYPHPEPPRDPSFPSKEHCYSPKPHTQG